MRGTTSWKTRIGRYVSSRAAVALLMKPPVSTSKTMGAEMHRMTRRALEVMAASIRFRGDLVAARSPILLRGRNLDASPTPPLHGTVLHAASRRFFSLYIGSDLLAPTGPP